MIHFSRQKLAKYALAEISAGRSNLDLGNQLAATLLEYKKIDELDLLISDIAWLAESHGQTATAIVTSSAGLTPSQLGQLKAFVKKRLKVSEVSLANQKDKKLIGGFKLETATKSWDKSIAGELKLIKEGI